MSRHKGRRWVTYDKSLPRHFPPPRMLAAKSWDTCLRNAVLLQYGQLYSSRPAQCISHCLTSILVTYKKIPPLRISRKSWKFFIFASRFPRRRIVRNDKWMFACNAISRWGLPQGDLIPLFNPSFILGFMSLGFSCVDALLQVMYPGSSNVQDPGCKFLGPWFKVHPFFSLQDPNYEVLCPML